MRIRETTKNRIRIAAIGVIIASFVVHSPLIDDLSRIALIGLFSDWAYQLYKHS